MALADVFDRTYCLRVVSEGQFIQRLHGIPEQIWLNLQAHFSTQAGAHLCHNVRISRSRIVQGKEYKGKQGVLVRAKGPCLNQSQSAVSSHLGDRKSVV